MSIKQLKWTIGKLKSDNNYLRYLLEQAVKEKEHMNAEDIARRGDIAKLRRVIDSLAPLAEIFADEKAFNSIAYKYFEPIEQGIYTA